MKRDYASYGLAVAEATVKVVWEVSCSWYDDGGRFWGHKQFFDTKAAGLAGFAHEREVAHEPSPEKDSTAILLVELETVKSKDSARTSRKVLSECS